MSSDRRFSLPDTKKTQAHCAEAVAKEASFERSFATFLGDAESGLASQRAAAFSESSVTSVSNNYENRDTDFPEDTVQETAQALESRDFRTGV